MTVQYILCQTIYYFAGLLEVLILVRVVLSWFPMRRGGGILGIMIGLVYAMTDPIMGPVRRMLEKSPLGGSGFMFDLSPIFSYFIISTASLLLRQLVMSF